MIKLIAPSKLHQKLNLDEINRKIEFAFSGKNVLGLKWHLEGMRFDQRFTKPIDVSGWDILKILNQTNQEVFIGTYTQNFFAWKLFPVNAYKPSHRVDVIKINLRQLDREAPLEWEQTIWHELTHIADHLSPLRFDHGQGEDENDLSGKDDSAPVKFARTMAALTLPNNQKGNCMSKSRKVVEVKTVKVKIATTAPVAVFEIRNSGKQVEMTDKDENYVKKAFTQFEKAQKILKKYFEQE